KDRYLLPMIGPAAVLTARCIAAYFEERPRDPQGDWVGWLHWGLLAGVAIGLPALGAMNIKGLRTIDGTPWYTPAFATAAIALAAILLIVGLWIHMTRRSAMTLITLLLMLLVGDVFMRGYRQTKNGLSE